MSMMVSFVLSFFPRDILDEILDLIESVSEGFPTYFSIYTATYITWLPFVFPILSIFGVRFVMSHVASFL